MDIDGLKSYFQTGYFCVTKVVATRQKLIII